MKKTLLFVISITAMVLSAAPWWNNQWGSRIKVTVSTGMTPKENALVALKLDVKDVKTSSIRVVDAENNAVPFAVRKDGNDNSFVAWRIAEPEMLEELDYYIYFDENDKPEVTEAAGFPKSLPGMNFVSNAAWTKKTADGDIAGWFCSSRGYGRADKWNKQNRKLVSVEEKDGRRALKIDGGTTVITFIPELEEGHIYRMSFEGYNCGPQLTTVTALFYDHTDSTFKIHRQYANYKMASGVPSPDSWIKSVNSKFGYIDNKTKTNHANVEKILPGTAGAVIEIEPRAKKTFYITNIVFEDITEKSLETTAGDVENVQK